MKAAFKEAASKTVPKKVKEKYQGEIVSKKTGKTRIGTKTRMVEDKSGEMVKVFDIVSAKIWFAKTFPDYVAVEPKKPGNIDILENW